MPWDGPSSVRGGRLQTFVERCLDDEARNQILNDADRTSVLTDELGQIALFGTTSSRDTLEELPNGFARAVWTLIEEPVSFERAEQARYIDSRRNGRIWDGFVTEKRPEVIRSAEALDRFKSAVRAQLNSRNVEVEVCQRMRPRLGETEANLVQLGIYHEGRSTERKAFVEGRLDRLADHPVIEAAITYERLTGAIEVVAKNRDSRRDFVRMFVVHLLGLSSKATGLPVRQYTLNQLRRPFAFSTDPEDNIEQVRVTLLRLEPLDSQAERVTLECMRRAGRNIWELAHERFREHDPLEDGFAITKACLTLTFKGSGPRTLPVTITASGCDLKDRTGREQLIGDKYLRRWGLLQNV